MKYFRVLTFRDGKTSELLSISNCYEHFNLTKEKITRELGRSQIDSRASYWDFAASELDVLENKMQQ